MSLVEKTPEQLAKEDLIRQTIEAAAGLLETKHTNDLYRAAWKKGAKLIRALIPDLINK